MEELAAPTGSVGHRLARLRIRCGLSRDQLATRTDADVGVDADLIARVEQGQVPASAAFTTVVARALGVDVEALTGQPYGHSSTGPHPEHAGLAALRMALDCDEDPEREGAPLPATELSTRLDQCEQHRSRAWYARLLAALPELLRHGYLIAHAARPGPDAEAAAALLTDAYVLAQTVAYHLGYLDLAMWCNHCARDAARRSGDPLRVAVTAGHRALLRLYRGDYFGALLLTGRTHDQITDQTSPAADAVRVELHLQEGLTHARLGDRDKAEGHLTRARELIVRGIPASPYYTVAATEANVDIHTVAIAVELGDATTALARAEGMKIPTGEEPARLGRHWIDLARAWTLHGDHTQALDALRQARHVAPELTRYDPQARETLRLLTEHDRRATDTLAGLARWAGIDI